MTNGTEASDNENADGESGARRGWTIALVGVAVVVVAGVVLAVTSSSDSSDDDSVTTDSVSDTTEATEVPETTSDAITSDAPVATDAPVTTTAPVTTDAPADSELDFMVNDIDDGGTVPVNFTCDGDDDVPILDVIAIPDGTQQLALIMDDPDAPTPDPFVHWVVYGIAADVIEISDGNDDFTYGLNDFGREGWNGPCPPPGGPHEYSFTLYSLDAALTLPDELDGRDLFTAIEPSILSEAVISASYERE